MFKFTTAFLIALGTLVAASAAQAACEGSLGRGWASGGGNGQFEMSAADRTCSINFANFINGDTRVPATEVALTQAPSNGTVAIAPGTGLIYTPNAGFTGSDRFCTRNTAPNVNGTLSGCITVTVR